MAVKNIYLNLSAALKFAKTQNEPNEPNEVMQTTTTWQLERLIFDYTLII